jgi:hypothetical protein
MLQNLIFLAASWFPLIAAAVLLIVFAARRFWRPLPFFFLYLVFAVVGGLTRYFASRIGGRTYFYTYWISDLLASLFFLLPVYEVFLRRIFPRFYKTPAYRNTFPVLAVLILILTVTTALQASDKGAAFAMASRGFDFMRTAVLIVFIGLVGVMGRQWTRFDLGITLGFAIQAAAALANAAVKARLHYRPTALDFIELGSYDVSCVIWLITFLKPGNQTNPPVQDHFAPAILAEAHTWEAMLKSWLVSGRNKR